MQQLVASRTLQAPDDQRLKLTRLIQEPAVLGDKMPWPCPKSRIDGGHYEDSHPRPFAPQTSLGLVLSPIQRVGFRKVRSFPNRLKIPTSYHKWPHLVIKYWILDPPVTCTAGFSVSALSVSIALHLLGLQRLDLVLKDSQVAGGRAAQTSQACNRARGKDY